MKTSGHCPLSRLTALLLATLTTAGCDRLAGSAAGDIGGRAAPELAVPAPLLQARAIDPDRLRPSVTLADGRIVDMRRDGERWRGTIDVLPGRDYRFGVLWLEDIDVGDRVRELPLASLERRVPVGPDGEVFVLEVDDYVYRSPALDFDGDGQSNFDERVAGTNPFGDGELTESEGDEDDEEDGEDEESAGDEENGEDTPDEDTTAPTDPEPDTDPTSIPTTPPVLIPVEEPMEPAPTPDESTPDESTPEASEPEEPASEGSTPEEPATDRPPVVADVVIPRIARADAPAIDGSGIVTGDDGVPVGEWAGATSFDAAGDRLFIDRLMIDQGTDESPGQAFRSWSAVHDGEFLYVLVIVEDDGRRRRDSPEVWRDDSLEIYLDGNDSGNTSYDDGEDDDSSRLMPMLASGTTRQGTSEGLVSGFMSVDAPVRIDFATGPGEGPRGIRRPRFEQDVYELRVELASAGIVPGRVFGFDLQVNDDDDGDDREAKWGWAHPARTTEDVDFTYLDPSFMGTAVLE